MMSPKQQDWIKLMELYSKQWKQYVMKSIGKTKGLVKIYIISLFLEYYKLDSRDVHEYVREYFGIISKRAINKHLAELCKWGVLKESKLRYGDYYLSKRVLTLKGVLKIFERCVKNNIIREFFHFHITSKLPTELRYKLIKHGIKDFFTKAPRKSLEKYYEYTKNDFITYRDFATSLIMKNLMRNIKRIRRPLEISHQVIEGMVFYLKRKEELKHLLKLSRVPERIKNEIRALLKQPEPLDYLAKNEKIIYKEKIEEEMKTAKGALIYLLGKPPSTD
jgi:hypothetical protein